MINGRHLFLLGLLLFSVSAKGQFSDDFSDGNFSSNPVWVGETARFTVSAGQELRSQGLAITDTIYLATAHTTMDSAEWEFWIRLNFAPSSNNYVQVYLASDQQNLQGPLNGYYLKIGENLSADGIDLYRQSGTVHTLILSGRDSTMALSGSQARIKVMREPSGLWTVWSDTTGGTGFVPEGSTTDMTFTTSNYFGVHCRHTSTNAANYYFDDFYAGGYRIDTVPPSIVTVTATSSTTVDVQFDEWLEPASAENELNYTASNGLGNPTTALLDAGDSSLVHLSFGTTFTNGFTYTLTVNSVADTAGNPMVSPGGGTFSWFVAPSAAYRDVIINEIFADPDTAVTNLPIGEFVEIYNRGTQTFDLNGWKFMDAATTVTLGSHLLAPGDYLILCKAADTASYSPWGNVLAVSLPALNNAGDQLGLRNAAGTLIDTVSYDLSWYNDLVKQNGGWTLELINPTDTCSLLGNWTASNDPDGGTPGTQNSVFNNTPDATPPSLASVTVAGASSLLVCFDETMNAATLSNAANYSVNAGLGTPVSAVPSGTTGNCVTLTFASVIDTGIAYTLTCTGLQDCKGNTAGPLTGNFMLAANPQPAELIINEIFADPQPAVGLPNAEFVELYNNSANILELGSLEFSDGSSTGALSAFVIQPGEYVILTAAASVDSFTAFGNVIGMSPFPSLNNSGDSLILKTATGTVIDQVNYDISWYQDAIKDDGGWTLELINPGDTCSAAGNWKASTDTDGGTPGAINSVFSTSPDLIPPSLVSITITGPNTVLVCFDEGMDAAQLGLSSNYSVDNGIGPVLSVIPVAPDYFCAEMSFSAPIDTGTVYTLTCSNLADCHGNAAGPLSGTFVQGAPPIPFEIVINEIFPDPSPVLGLPDAEFIELKNAGTRVIDLAGMQLTDGSSTAVLPQYALQPGGHVILTNPADVGNYAAFGDVLGVSGFPSLNNSGDSLVLMNGSGTLFDQVVYTDGWYQDDSKAEGGWTLERIDPAFTCDNPGNWRASVSMSPQGGTPGTLNSVSGTFTDSIPPSLDYAITVNASLVRVFFDEGIDPASAGNTSDYVIDNGIGNPVAVSAGSGFPRFVDLLLSAALDSNTVYCVTVSNVKDCPGNTIVSGSACFGVPVTPVPGDLVINEILFNPYTGGSDYVELYNLSAKVIDLNALQLGEIFPGTDSIINSAPATASRYLLLPGEYIALTPDKGFTESTYLPVDPDAVVEVSDFPSFDDDEGEVVISNPDGTLLDRFHYLDDYHFPALDNFEGVSLERLSFIRASDDPGNWHSAASTVNYGTPGYENSQLFNDTPTDGNVWLSPVTFSPDNDGVEDNLFINYLFNVPGYNLRATVFDNRGRLIKFVSKGALIGTDENFLTWDGSTEAGDKADVGIYVILVEATNYDTGKVEKFKLGCVVAARF